MSNTSLLTESFPEISHLSASNLNKWNGEWSDEGLWCLSYLYKKKFQGNAASVRGQVIEDCFLRVLRKKDEELLDFAQRSFVLKIEEIQKESDLEESDIEKEFNVLQGYIEQCYRSIEELQLKLPNATENATQLKVNMRLKDTIPWELLGYIDFDFGDCALDLKTTNRIPRKGIKANHKRQIGFYAKARGERIAKILYLSPKDYEFYAMYDREIDVAFDELVFRAESLCNRLEAAAILAKYRETTPKEEFTKLVTPDMSGWGWGDEEMMFAAEQGLWGVKTNNKTSII